jgi:hypothetical protein
MPSRPEARCDPPDAVEEYELPAAEALLAGTLALMTGYGQALQANSDPARRLAFNLRIADNLERLSQQDLMSGPFRALSVRLAGLWQQMARCTAEARAECHAAGCPQAMEGCSTTRRHLH